MTSRATSAGVGLMLAALLGWAAIGGDAPSEHGRGLCVDGRPAPRSPYVTYGGLSPRPGYERDHYLPLCLGGPDTRDNVRYQPLAEARDKDRWERALCEAYCRGDISLDEARRRLEDDWPR